MDFIDYIERSLLILKIYDLPLDDINAKVGFLRLQKICLYKSCLQYVIEKFL